VSTPTAPTDTPLPYAIVDGLVHDATGSPFVALDASSPAQVYLVEAANAVPELLARIAELEAMLP
jgi:hypothetical protein